MSKLKRMTQQIFLLKNNINIVKEQEDDDGDYWYDDHLTCGTSK